LAKIWLELTAMGSRRDDAIFAFRASVPTGTPFFITQESKIGVMSTLLTKRYRLNLEKEMSSRFVKSVELTPAP
jgi:hypothetical protein